MGKQQEIEMKECAQPSQLMEAWLAKDLATFKRVLDEGVDPNFLFTEDGYQPILAIIARDGNSDAKTFLHVLLGYNVNVNEQYRSGRCAIHLAAEAGNLEILQELISANVNINALDQTGSAALHLLVKQKWNPSLKRCTEFLLKQDNLEINRRNNSGFAPIDLALRYKNKEAVIALLEKGTLIDVDGILPLSGGVNVRSAIIKMDPNLEKDLPPTFKTETIRMGSDKLFLLLDDEHQERFCEAFDKEMQDKSRRDLLTCSNGMYTFLQFACERNLQKVVEVLLKHDVDVNQVANDSTPSVIIACRKGYSKILQLLLSKNVNLHPPTKDETSPLHWVAKFCKDSPDHLECLKLLLQMAKEGRMQINNTDVLGNTALHYAVLYSDDAAVLELLKHGAYLGVKNKRDQTPMFRMPHRILKEFLDWNLREDGTQQYSEDYSMTYNYQFLIPPSNSPNISVNISEETQMLDGGTIDQGPMAPETEPLLIMSKTKELEGLLNHPILTSFTYLKWQRIQSFYYLNLFFYTAFCILLTCYILFCYRSLPPVGSISSNALDDVSSEKIGIHEKVNYTKPTHSEIEVVDSNLIVKIIRIIILCFISILFIRELFQFAVKPLAYLMNVENWLELILLLISTVLIIGDCSRAIHGSLGYICPQLCAIAILLSFIELVLFIGKHPRFSVQVEMFRKVTISFFKFLSCYVLLIIAFALSFYVLFRGCSGECADNNPFTNPGTSLFKTMVMLTGEFESGEIPFLTYIGTSHIIFTAFVFLIAIVLLNLLNGLAVADTKIIRDKSYLHTCKARVKLIVFVEELLLGRTANFFSSTFGFFSFLNPYKLNISVIGHFRKNIKFFPLLIPKGYIISRPHDDNCIEFVGRSKDGQQRNKTQYYIDPRTMKDAIEILVLKREKSDTSGRDEILKNVTSCSDRLSELTNKITAMENRFEIVENSNKQLEQLLIQNLAIISLQNNIDR